MRDQEKEQLLKRIHAGLRGFVNDEYRWQAAKAAAIVCVSEIAKVEKDYGLLIDDLNRLEDFLISSNRKIEKLEKIIKGVETFNFWIDMYEVVLKSWYQELPDEIQEEIMHECDNIEDAWNFLKQHAEHYIEFYPLTEMSIRLKN